MKKLWKWFEHKMLKITYSIGADFNIYDSSVIVVIRFNNRTGKMEIMSNTNYRKMPYGQFIKEVRYLAKRYRTLDYFVDKPYNF